MMPHPASSYPNIDYLMPCLASFFDAMSGVKKLTNFMHSITYQTSAYKPSAVFLTEEKEVLIMAPALFECLKLALTYSTVNF